MTRMLPVLERLPGVGLLGWGPPGPRTPLLPSSSPLLHPRLLFFPPGNHDVQVLRQLQTPNEASCLVRVPPPQLWASSTQEPHCHVAGTQELL